MRPLASQYGLNDRDQPEAGRQHVGARLPPVWQRGNVEYREVFGRRGGCYRMAPTTGELEMVLASGSAEHDTLETLVIFEAAQHTKIEAAAVHRLRNGKIPHRFGYPQMVLHQWPLKPFTGTGCRFCGRTPTFLRQARL